MALSTKLELRQSQQLVMTPQLQQAIRLLQLSNVELAQFVEREIERNPLLERDETSGAADPASEPEEPPIEPGAQDGTSDDPWLDLARPVEEPAGPLDTEYDNVFPDAASQDGFARNGAGSSWNATRPLARHAGGDDFDLEDFVPAPTSLKHHLDQQLSLALKSPADRAIGQGLIDMVDEAGYLTAGVDDIAAMLGVAGSAVERVLVILQTLDPPGIFARSLAECLALQLKERNRYDPWMASLLAHLDLVAAHDLDTLKKTIGVGIGDLIDMIGELKRLDPRPGSRFGAEAMRPIVPDVLVRAAGSRDWIVELNAATLPRVLVNRDYCARVSRGACSEKDRGYIQECLQTANWLTRSLEQRARTILRVAEEIVRQQHAFLARGVQHLRPLNLRTVAEAIAMHESTVSRVTSNKYMATPRGVFELKYFFTSAINGTGLNECHSSEAVRERIRRLIQEETARGVLSDDKIVELLRSGGVDIARRTVAKYREAMRIPSSVQRRRAKRLHSGA